MAVPNPQLLRTTTDFVSACSALGARQIGGPLSTQEKVAISRARPFRKADDLAAQILEGGDPLGNALLKLRSGEFRRQHGVFYTPPEVVEAMARWSLGHEPSRVVDPGCGSGRFAREAVGIDPSIELHCLDIDPLATLATRASLAVLGAGDATVVNTDYVRWRPSWAGGKTAYVGNPPYVRHHLLDEDTKSHGQEIADDLGLRFSGRSDLHVYFMMSTLKHATKDDVGCFITSGQWLDGDYGVTIRDALLNGAGGLGIHLFEPDARAFVDARTTATVTTFQVGSAKPQLRVGVVGSANRRTSFKSGRSLTKASLGSSDRWMGQIRGTENPDTSNLVPLGDHVRVMRGVATGANGFFVLRRDEAAEIGLAEHCVPVVSSAKQITALSRPVVRAVDVDTVLLQAPEDLEHADAALLSYLKQGKRQEVHERRLSRDRRHWWHIPPNAPPIFATYMSKAGPTFAANPDRICALNSVHGLIPHVPLGPRKTTRLVDHLNELREGFRGGGRTYQGGLEKFEPGEMQRLLVPAELFE